MALQLFQATPGGMALMVDYPITLINDNGIIAGGGGGGGGSAEQGGSNDNNYPGGGGAGIPGGQPGEFNWSSIYAARGQVGGIDSGGYSGYNSTTGKGGNKGLRGNNGTAVGSTTNVNGPGANPGYAIYGMSNVQSFSGNNASHVFGPVV